MLKKLGITLLLGLVLTSCSGDVEDTSAPGNVQGEGRLKTTKNSSFVVNAVKESSVSFSSEYTQEWKDIPTHSLIQFEACLVDIAKAQPVIDQKFLVKSPLGEQKRFTQTNGCLRWSELISFDFLEKERLIEFPVSIQGLGRYPGIYHLNLAVNPWPSAQKHVFDLDHDQTSYPVKKLNANFKHTVEDETLDVSSISFKQIKREVDQENKVDTLNYDLEMNLELKRKNIQGSLQQTRLTQGLFKIELALIEKNRDEQAVYLIGQTQISARINDSTIKETLSIQVPRENYPKTHSQTELYVKISPQMAPESLKYRQGLLDMNGLNNLKTQELRALESIESEKGLKQMNLATYTMPREYGQKADYVNEQDFGIKMEKVHLSWGSLVGSGDHQRSTRTVRANFSTVLKDPSSVNQSEPITDSYFSIRVYPETESENVQTLDEQISKVQSNGEISGHFHIKYDLYNERPRWIPMVIELTGLNGEVRGLTKKRVVEVNPWNKNDFGYDTVFETTPKMLDIKPPRIVIPDVAYKSEGKDLNSFRLNKYMQMSFAKRYQVQLAPKLELGHSYNDQRDLSSITFGDYEMEMYIYTPLNANADYQEIDLNDFQFLSAAKRDVTVQSSGYINTNIDLPFYFTEMFQLPYKNLAIVKLKSKTSHLESDYFAVPFYANDKNAQLRSVEISKSQTYLLQDEKIQEILKTGVKDVEAVLTEEQKKNSPIEHYRSTFKKGLEASWRSSGEVTLINRIELNELPSVGSTRPATDEENITEDDFRMLSTQTGAMPKVVLKKFCRHFFPAPQDRLLKGFGPSREKKVGGKEYLECLKNPRQSIQTQGLIHVQEILSKGREKDLKGALKRYPKATLINQSRGEISLGMGFYAAEGKRSWEAKGTQDVTSFTQGAELFLHAPAPMLMVFNAGMSQAHEVVSQKVDGDMQVTFDRNYRQLGKPNLEFNRIELEFTANIRRCLAVTNSKKIMRAFHICEEDDRLMKLSEQWFFIGEKHSQVAGTITDPQRPGDTTHTQIIRGQHQFNELWAKYKSEDVAFLIESLPDKELYAPLIHYKLNNENRNFFKAYHDQNFPGLMTPYEFRQ